MQPLKLGTIFCLSLALASCRNSFPPLIGVCIGDGFGGADCVLKDNTRVYKTPMNLKNYWMTSPEDMKAFSAWCYDVPPDAAQAQMQQMQVQLK